MRQGRMFGFTYSSGTGQPFKPFKMRDGLGLVALSSALARLGYVYEDTFINFAPEPGQEPDHVDPSEFREDDLIVIPLRPPLDDEEIGNKRSIQRSHTVLEVRLFDALRRVFRTCARSEVVLQNHIAGIATEIAKRGSIEFFQNNGAMYQRFSNLLTGRSTICRDRVPMTAAYYVHLEHAWDGGPGLIVAFGMGGTETLIWCTQLATRYRHLLGTAAFAMAEMPAAPPSLRAASVRSFADAWDVRILGTAPLRGAPSDGYTGPLAGGSTGGGIEAQP